MHHITSFSNKKDTVFCYIMFSIFVAIISSSSDYHKKASRRLLTDVHSVMATGTQIKDLLPIIIGWEIGDLLSDIINTHHGPIPVGDINSCCLGCIITEVTFGVAAILSGCIFGCTEGEGRYEDNPTDIINILGCTPGCLLCKDDDCGWCRGTYSSSNDCCSVECCFRCSTCILCPSIPIGFCVANCVAGKCKKCVKSCFDKLQHCQRTNNGSLPQPAIHLMHGQDANECCVCFGENGQKNAMFLPCKHRLCNLDAQILFSSGHNCPLCRSQISHIQQV